MSTVLRIVEQWYASDVGRQRHGNEDSFYVRAPLFVVADGMGGAQSGEVASEMAVKTFEQPFQGGEDPQNTLVGLIQQANQSIFEYSQSQKGQAGMGTTLTAAFVGSEEVIVAHVGDSRAYCLRGSEMIRLTTDHSLVSELVARGKLTEQQAAVHPQRSVITRALGPEPEVAVDVEAFSAEDGDVFLLCSDGLTGMVKERTIAAIIAKSPTLAQAGAGLIASANEAGGRDNITVVLFRVDTVEQLNAQQLSNITAERITGESSTQEFASALVTEEVVGSSLNDTSNNATAEPDANLMANLDSSEMVVVTKNDHAHEKAAKNPKGSRRYFLRGFFVLLAVTTLIMGGWFATRSVYFIGTDPKDAQTVTIFRGLPYELPAGIKLYERYEPSGITITQVPEDRFNTFTDHKLRTRKDAEGLISALERGELR